MSNDRISLSGFGKRSSNRAVPGGVEQTEWSSLASDGSET